MKITLSVEGRFYNALRIVAAKNDTRYYLNGILFDFKNERLAATNGHRLLTIPMNFKWTAHGGKEELPDELIITTMHRKVKDHVDFEITKSKEGNWVVFGVNFKTSSASEWQEMLEVVDGKFPDISRVIPDWPKENGTVPLAAYNPMYVADVAKELQLKMPATRVIPSSDANSSALVEFHTISHEQMTYVLMPMRWG